MNQDDRWLGDVVAPRTAPPPRARGLADAALAALAHSVLVFDDTGLVIDANSAFLSLSGISDEDSVAALPRDALFVSRPSGAVELLIDVLLGPDAPSRGEASFRRIDGRVLDVSFTAARFGYGGRSLLAVTVADVTAEKCLTCKIHMSREKYRQVVDDHPELLVRLLPDTTVTFANDAFAARLERLPHEIVGQRLDELIDVSAIDGLVAWMHAVTPAEFVGDSADLLALSTGGNQVIWRRRAIFGPDGALLTVQLSGRDGAGVAAAASLAAIGDVAEVHARLRESEDRQRRVLSALQEGVLLIDRRGQILQINAAARAILGLESVAVTHIYQVRQSRVIIDRHGASMPDRALPLAEALRTGCSVEGRILGLLPTSEAVSCRDGAAAVAEAVWLRVNAQPILLPGHQADGALGLLSFTDVTDLVRAEDAMREHRRRLRAVLDHTFAFIGVLDAAGMVLDVNRTALDFIGADIESVRGLPFWETPWWRDDPQAVERLRAGIAAAAAGEFVRFETAHRDPLNKSIIVDFSLSPVRNDSGEVVLLIPEGRDISSLKKTERRLQSAVVAAEAANATKTHFLAHMSHELRTPLNAILGYTEAMMDEIFGPLENDHYREYLRIIHGSGRHLLDLLGDILEVSRIELGQLTVTPENVPLRAVAEEAATILRGRAEDLGVALDLEVEDGLTIWRCDRRHLLQVLLNLGANAIKYTGRCGRVSIALRRQNHDLLVEVRDTGVGISPDALRHIWEPFRQGESSLVSSGGGLGLGLAIVRRLVEAQRGTVAIESALGKGTAVSVSLPANL